VLAGYVDASSEPRAPDATLRKIAAILDDRKVATAVDTLLPDND
jgi:hypothetical protein